MGKGQLGKVRSTGYESDASEINRNNALNAQLIEYISKKLHMACKKSAEKLH